MVRLGSRGSRLALIQAELAADALRAVYPDVDVAIVPMTTAGDRDRSKPFGEIGERGVFVKEIEEALLAGRIDAAVHSAKDMTSTNTAGLAVGAYLPREDARDALCGADGVRPGMRDRHRLRAAPRRAARPRADALRRALARERRHAPAQDGRARARRHRPFVGWASTVSGSLQRSATGFRPRSCFPRPGRAPSPSRFAPARRSSSRPQTTPRRAAASKPSARVSPGSAAAASRPWRPTTTAAP